MFQEGEMNAEKDSLDMDSLESLVSVSKSDSEDSMPGMKLEAGESEGVAPLNSDNLAALPAAVPVSLFGGHGGGGPRGGKPSKTYKKRYRGQGK